MAARGTLSPFQASAERISDAVNSADFSGGRLDMRPVTSRPLVAAYPRAAPRGVPVASLWTVSGCGLLTSYARFSHTYSGTQANVLFVQGFSDFTESGTKVPGCDAVLIQGVAGFLEEPPELHFHLPLKPRERRRIDGAWHVTGRPDGDRDAREGNRYHKSVPFDPPRARGGIGQRQDRSARHLREEDGAGLELEARSLRAIGRDDRGDV